MDLVFGHRVTIGLLWVRFLGSFRSIDRLEASARFGARKRAEALGWSAGSRHGCPCQVSLAERVPFPDPVHHRKPGKDEGSILNSPDLFLEGPPFGAEGEPKGEPSFWTTVLTQVALVCVRTPMLESPLRWHEILCKRIPRGFLGMPCMFCFVGPLKVYLRGSQKYLRVRCFSQTALLYSFFETTTYATSDSSGFMRMRQQVRG